MNNLTFIGMAGCGKSTLGRALSNKLGIACTDTDELIEKKFDQSLEDLKIDKGYKFVRLAEEGVILNLSNDIEIISTGGSAVYSEKWSI
jgi:shikimate kinase